MVFLCKFEIYRDRSGMFRSVPFGLSGEILGHNYRDVCERTVEWLKQQGETLLSEDKPLPELPIGNFPKGGGRILLVAVEADAQPQSSFAYGSLTGIPAVDPDAPPVVSASQAAELLGVSRSRISQMTRSGALEGFRRGRDAFVTVASIEARLAQPPRRGRPKRPKDANTGESSTPEA